MRAAAAPALLSPLSPLSPLSSILSLLPLLPYPDLAVRSGVRVGGRRGHTHTHSTHLTHSTLSLFHAHTSHHVLCECERRRSKWTSGLVNLSWSAQAEKAGETASTNEGIFNLDIISMFRAVFSVSRFNYNRIKKDESRGKKMSR